jgi:hypothetical protein
MCPICIRQGNPLSAAGSGQQLKTSDVVLVTFYPALWADSVRAGGDRAGVSVASGGGEMLIARFRVEHSALSATLHTAVEGLSCPVPICWHCGLQLSVTHSDKCYCLPGQAGFTTLDTTRAAKT